ncbi:MAG TPA: L-glutamate gamma-semialdehyde dehydrogenase [Chloroflexota bacterium]|nr:L-glutamate gamma-semialdehyde dehydrogenase [Chloroflexota bacterium]
MTLPPFTNQPLTDFSNPQERDGFERAIALVEAEHARERPLVIGGAPRMTGSWIESRDPSDHQRIVGRVAKASTHDAEDAVRAAEGAYPGWSRTPAIERAALGLRAASIMRRRRHELSATMVLEVGKTWPEADADTAEAIDFLEYYAREALALDGAHPVIPIKGTASDLRYVPIGVGVAIPPWNFPLAIAMGLVSSAILTGNTVIFKPSSLAPVVGAKIVEVLDEAGAPPGVVNFVPGPGDSVGDFLVAHPRVRFINFTGSRDVGVRISSVAGRIGDGQLWIKRVIAEMGGKNAIIVDPSGDLDLAVSGILASAFGFQGQKCSACSRVIADGSVYDEVVARVASGAEALRVGPAKEIESDMGPVADGSQFRKIAGYIEAGRGEGRLVAGGERDDSIGYFIHPTVFADVPPTASIMQEEIFGPVVAITKSRDFVDALAIANGTQYGLTGGVFARDPAKLDLARREFHVGNLYFNRKITGALVGVEPFGGFKLSGTDAKAGGPDYLKYFLEAKVISERL